MGLLRLLTRRAVLGHYGLPPRTNAQAWGAFENLQEDDRVGPLLDEPPGVEQVWRRLSSRSSASPQLWTDTYLAAFAITAGATFVTIDRAFTQFPALDLRLIE
jgi:toxin-antitoxin system PIN domain toxin